MKLSDKAFTELKQIVAEEISNDLNDSEIETIGIDLLSIFSEVVMPLPKETEND